ncbi:hypothetical protein CDL15_Pgr022963 [Punica granatum]|nr:hypothetical protein CDL15_Pgr022963 [Punica granatum]PKI50743.1 hypothetical protein CRG98_028885 [Punica granatum]
MTRRISTRVKKFLSCYGSGSTGRSRAATNLDVQEEYANAFRTESYNEFWDRVLELSNQDLATCQSRTTGSPSTTAARLPSYRLFLDDLLEPDQATITQILSLTRYGTAHKSLLAEYFSETANASLLCSVLLKDLDHTRAKYRNMKSALKSACMSHAPDISAHLMEVLNSNPSVSSASPGQVQSMQAGCSRLLKQLESARDKVRAKIGIVSKIKNGSATVLVALSASLVIVIMAHGVPLLVAAPGLLAASFELASPRMLAKTLVELDAAAKGTYILKRDMDTIGRFVSRLNDELEHMREMSRFWLERGEEQLHTSEEVAQQLGQNDCSFTEQLDELEEHLYLCFMTINRARNLVMKEIIDPGLPARSLKRHSSP